MRLIALLLTLFLPMTATAQPSMKPLGPSILDTGSSVVTTDSITLPGPEGRETPYRIGILIPKRETPEAGFPVLFTLDGQAVMELLSDAYLGELETPLPVIVTLGYDTDRRFAGEERTRDYTPPASDGGTVEDPRGRIGGGAAEFLALIREEVIPALHDHAPVDMSRSVLWGHSYAGLFTLWASGEPSAPFAHYVAASPSLWWDSGSFLQDVIQRSDEWPNRRLDLHKGEMERERASKPDNENAQKLAKIRSAMPQEALEEVATRLRAAGVPGEYRVFPGLSHGETFRASIKFLVENGIPATEDF